MTRPFIQTIEPATHDLGGFKVRRSLPARERTMVGPFVFFDQAGPARLDPRKGIDVRPHPHINLATVTYMFEGRFEHRDSLGTVQVIEPGAVNLMTAGSGIVHSERSPAEDRPDGPEIFAVLYAGTIYADIRLAAGGAIPIDAGADERALYLLEGDAALDGTALEVERLHLLRPGYDGTLRSGQGARIMLCGGEAFAGPRHVYWNFVSSRKERIEQAIEDWKAERFAPIPGDSEERIPFPEGGPKTVSYP
ncbi:MAG: pirin family protein [Sphingomonadales bacterium]|nr:pirin family protein [Sphingomonadales bacterium]